MLEEDLNRTLAERAGLSYPTSTMQKVSRCFRGPPLRTPLVRITFQIRPELLCREFLSKQASLKTAIAGFNEQKREQILNRLRPTQREKIVKATPNVTVSDNICRIGPLDAEVLSPIPTTLATSWLLKRLLAYSWQRTGLIGHIALGTLTGLYFIEAACAISPIYYTLFKPINQRRALLTGEEQRGAISLVTRIEPPLRETA